MYCNNCGHKNSKLNKYCEICGANLTAESIKRPKYRRNLIFPIVISVLVCVLILLPLFFDLRLVNFVVSFVLFLIFTPLVIKGWDHIFFKDDEIFQVITWIGLKKAEYKISSIGKVKISEKFILARAPMNKQLYITVYSKNGMALFEFAYSPETIAWFKYYGIEVINE
jgi:hypothetical protein